jgi:hypothetical protein
MKPKQTWINVPIRASDGEAIKVAAAADQRSAASLIRKILADWVASRPAPPVQRRQQESVA